ncbi:MAG: protein kinase, partial [Myxococcaceae bacterium]
PPPIIVWGAMILLNRYLSKNPSYELFPMNARYITAISLLVTAKLLEKSNFSVTRFIRRSQIPANQINQLISIFLKGICLDLHLSPAGMRQLFRVILQGEDSKSEVLRLLEEHRPNRLTSILPPGSLIETTFECLPIQGSYGEIFMSENEVLKLFLKCSKPSSLASTDVFSEILCGGIFQHPNLMSTSQFCCGFDSKKNPCWGALMPRCLGGDLCQIVKDTGGAFELKKIKKYMFQLLSALKYLHENEFSHNDVKTQNLFLDGDDLRLGDYSLSKVNEPSVPHKDWVIQTIMYRPPEVFLGVSLGCQSDIWAAACVMAEMALGDFLFSISKEDSLSRDNIFSQMRAFLGESFILPHWLESEDAQKHWMQKRSELFKILGPLGYELFRAMLDPDHKTRITAAEALKHEFFENPESV